MAGWSKRVLLIVLLAAAALRLGRLAFFTPVVEGDGCEYARLAENLVAGRGYVGMLAGAEIMLPPLYPVTIAIVMKATQMEAPLAGRCVSLLASLAFALLLARLVEIHGGGRAARLALILTAFSPGMILLGSAVFAEALQLALLSGGAVALAVALQAQHSGRAFVAGLWFGAAYLARVESVVVAVLGAGALFASGWIGRRRCPRPKAAGLAMTLLLGFALAASPYVIYLHQVTGEVRLEGKSERVSATIARYAQGLPYREANYGLGENGEVLGPWLVPNEILVGGPSLLDVAAGEPIAFLRHVLSNLALLFWKLLTGEAFSSIFLVALAGVAFLKFAPKREVPLDLWLLATLAASLALGSLYKFVLRYAVGVGLPLYALTALGSAALWTHLENRRGRRFHWGSIALATILVLASITRGFFTGNAEFHESLAERIPQKTLGLELRRPTLPIGTLMSVDTRSAYYARRRWTPLPVAPTARAFWLEVLRRGATLLVLDSSREYGRPGAWWSSENLPRPATLVAEVGSLRAYSLDLMLAEEETAPR